MKKVFGWIFLIAGIGNIIRAIGMASDGGAGVGELFLFGIGFLILGAWMISSSKKKFNNIPVNNDTKEKIADIPQEFNKVETPKDIVVENTLSEKDKDTITNVFLTFIVFLVLILVLCVHLFYDPTMILPICWTTFY